MHLRFFVSKETFLNTKFVITDVGIIHQLSRVLRAKPGDEVELLDGTGNVYRGKINDIGKREISGSILNSEFRPDAPKRVVALYQSLIKKDNFELVLQKGTELGITIFVPVIASRSVKIKDEIPARWYDIVREAAEQCGRTQIPKIKPILKFKDAVKSFSGTGILAHEEEKQLQINDVISDTTEVSVFIGPEGGFSPEEIELAKSQKISIISLGKNVLRAETAGIVVAALTIIK